MFDIHEIYLKNFKSYAGEHTFTFPDEPGLYFLTGLNKQEPKLGSNGAGKSTLLDAIYWCLFGRSLRGLKSADVVTWGLKSNAVAVTLTVGARRFTVRRTIQPNTLKIDGQIVDQEAVQKWVRLTPESFLYSVIAPQFGQAFFELLPSFKLSLFSQIMGLEYWLEKSQKAQVEAEEFEKESRRITQNMTNANELLIEGEASIESLQVSSNDFDSEKSTVSKDLLAKAGEFEVQLVILRAEEDQEAEDAERLRDVEDEKQRNVHRIEAAMEAYIQKRNEANILYNTIEARQKDAKAIKRRLVGIRSTCPTCLQKVDSGHLEKELKILNIKLKTFETELDKVAKQWSEAKDFVAKTIRDLDQARSAMKQAERDKNKATDGLTATKAEISFTRNRIKGFADQAKAEKARTNPYVALLKEKQASLDKLKAKIKADTKTLLELSAKYEAVKFWINGFKRVRLFIIEETLRTLEVEVNSNLAALGLPDWQIEFDVERENKSGGMTKGFVVLIRNPDHPEPVKWESWSGGEAQRLLLAGNLGLANLIMQQAGLTGAIEFYDEPSKHLTDSGVMTLAESLQQRAIDSGKRIWLIDHRTVDFGDFAQTVRVVKDAKGSKLEIE